MTPTLGGRLMYVHVVRTIPHTVSLSLYLPGATITFSCFLCLSCPLSSSSHTLTYAWKSRQTTSDARALHYISDAKLYATLFDGHPSICLCVYARVCGCVCVISGHGKHWGKWGGGKGQRLRVDKDTHGTPLKSHKPGKLTCPNYDKRKTRLKQRPQKLRLQKCGGGVFFQGADHFARRPEKAKVRLENFRVNNIFQILCKSFSKRWSTNLFVIIVSYKSLELSK